MVVAGSQNGQRNAQSQGLTGLAEARREQISSKLHTTEKEH
jgi:hypothetical protein